MLNKHIPIEEFKKISELTNCKIILFGSRVWSIPKINSDLDIAIISKNSKDYADAEDMIMNSNCPYIMDILNLNMLNNEKLKERILTDGFQI